VIPPDHDGEYVACMEDVLTVYERPYDPEAPVVCMDEQPVQLTKVTRQSIPAAAGRPARIEYERNGTAEIFMFSEPKAGWRDVSVRERRTKLDRAQEMRRLLDGRYAGVPKITLVMDNLNTHTAGSLYEAFPPVEARRLAQRLEIRYTPTLREMRSHIAAWQRKRNQEGVQVGRRFTLDRARERMRRVYPRMED
jgi:hypothetical protein